MTDSWECMCLECGISNMIELEGVILDELQDGGIKVVRDVYCSECGGPLLIVGRAGEEPFYRTA